MNRNELLFAGLAALVSTSAFAQPSAPPAEAPAFCAVLTQLLEAAPSGFSALRGAPQPKDPAVFASTVTLPGSAKCLIATGQEATEGVTTLLCAGRPLSESVSGQEIIQARKEALDAAHACLGPPWDVEEASLSTPGSISRPQDLGTPRVEVDFRVKLRVLTTSIVMARPPFAPSQAFCDALGPIVGSSVNGFADIGGKRVMLPGTRECSINAEPPNPPELLCHVGFFDDGWAAHQAWLASATAIGACMPPEWSTKGTVTGNAEFRHPSPEAPVIRVVRLDQSYQAAETLKALGMKRYKVWIGVGVPGPKN